MYFITRATSNVLLNINIKYIKNIPQMDFSYLKMN